MKNVFQLTAILFAGTLLFMSCSKSGDDGTFDPAHPEGYMVAGVYKHDFIHPTVDMPLIMKFIAGNKIEFTTYASTVTKSYQMSNDTFYIQGPEEEELVIKNGMVTRYVYASDIRGYSLNVYKVPGSNQLEGKTFTGKYYKPDGSILHNSFFYSFTAGLKLNAGYNVGTIERTNEYTSIANVASRSVPASGQIEFTLLLNDVLYSTYYTGGILQFGVLNPQ